MLSQANLSANYDREGNILPVGQAISRDYASDAATTSRAGQLAPRVELTITAGLRYGLYSPPYEVNGLQVAPTISMGEWFDKRAEGMAWRIVQSERDRHLRSRGSENGGTVLRLGQEQLCAAACRGVDAARDQGALAR